MVEWHYFGLVAIASVIGAFGAVYLKSGAKEIKGSIIQIIKTKKIFIGIFLYGLASLFTLIALKNENVSVIYPLSAMSYVWAAVLSKKYFREKISVYQWMGILSILLGVFLIVQ